MRLIIILVSVFLILFGECRAAETTGEIAATKGAPMPVAYPPEIYGMTDTEFFDWAVTRNAKEKNDWNEWHKTAPPKWLDYDTGGYGSSYNSSYGHGYRHEIKWRSFEEPPRRYLNPDAYDRPLTVVNPYCRPEPRTMQGKAGK